MAAEGKIDEKESKDHQENDALKDDNGILSIIISMLCCFNLGYRLKCNDSKNYKLPYNLQSSNDSYLTIIIDSLCDVYENLNLIRPIIVLHVVCRYTGKYLNEKKTISIRPLKSKSCSLKKQSTVPLWREQFAIDLNFHFVVNPQSVLLFEVMDTVDSSSFKLSSNNRIHPCRRVAWAFLLPIGYNNTMNVGVPPTWLHSYHNSKNNKIQKSSKLEEINPIHDNNDNNREMNEEDEGNIGDINNSLEKKRLLDNNEENNITLNKEDLLNNQDDISEINDLSLRLQLYKYRNEGIITRLHKKNIYNSTKLTTYTIEQKIKSKYINIDEAYPNDIPEVFWQWNRKKLIMMKAALKICTGCRVKKIVLNNNNINNENNNTTTSLNINSISNKDTLDTDSAAVIELRKAILQRSRGANELCITPNKLLHRLNVGPKGAMVTSFSNNHSLLAVSGPSSDFSSLSLIGSTLTSPLSGSAFSLRIFDSDVGIELCFDNIAHHGIVYDIKWTKLDRYIVTCSSDGSCKVWEILMNNNNIESNISFNNTNNNNNNNEISIQSLRSGLSYLTISPISTLLHMPPVFIYTAIFQEYSSNKGIGDLHGIGFPRVISGANDGRIRVWDQDKLAYECIIGSKEHSPHEGSVNSLVIDCRSRYLMSADSLGIILIWRTDGFNQYQLLRKFKRDDISSQNLNILSIVMNPNRDLGQILIYAKPSTLRLYNISNHKIQANFSGINLPGIFSKPQISTDGNIVVSADLDSNCNKIKFYDAQNGGLIPNPISEVVFPYPVRSISWHSKQHTIAIAILGDGASLLIYSAEKENIQKTIARKNANNINKNISNELDADIILSENEMKKSSPNINMKLNENVMLINTNKSRNSNQNSMSEIDSSLIRYKENEKESTKQLRAQKSKEILDKVKSLRSIKDIQQTRNEMKEKEMEFINKTIKK